MKNKEMTMKNDKNERNDITELVFILDKSGSMYGLEADTIGGFNSLIEEQKAKDGKCYVSTVLFSDRSHVLHDRVDLQKIEPMNRHQYNVGGCTALIDAIGSAIRHIGNVHKYARPEDVPGHTVFVITTDGYENASIHYTAEQVRRMVKRQKEKYDWEFIFLGANIDAVGTAGRFGIEEDCAINYNADSMGTGILFESISQHVGCVRANAAPDPSWRENLDADYKKRGRR